MSKTYDNNEVTLRDYMRVLFRQKWTVILTVLTVAIVIFVGLKLKTNIFEAKVKLLIIAEKQLESQYYKELYGGRNVQQTVTQSEIVRSNPVLERVVGSLALNKRPLDDEKEFSSPMKSRLVDYRVKRFKKKLSDLTPEQKEDFYFRRAVQLLKRNIDVVPIRDTNMFTINVRDYNPVGSAVIANVVSRSYIIFDLEQQLAELKLKYGDKHPSVGIISDSIEKLNLTLSGNPVDNIDAIGPATVKIIEQATVPMAPIGRSKTVTFIIAVALSLFFGVVMAFLFEYADQTIKTPSDVSRFLKLDYIGSIARTKSKRKSNLISQNKTNSKYYKSYQSIADEVCLLFKNKSTRSMLFTASTQKDICDKTIANIGIFLTQELQHKVLIIDANLRNSDLAYLLKLKNTSGLAGYLEGQKDIKDVLQRTKSGMDFIAAGVTKKNPVTLLESAKMKKLIEQATDEYEIVLVNSSAMNLYKDSVILSKMVDATTLTINEGKTRRQVIKDSCEQLKAADANIKGVILNNRTFPIPGFIYNAV